MLWFIVKGTLRYSDIGKGDDRFSNLIADENLFKSI